MTVEKVTISGFMILKNAVSQGYPFLEAIVAAFPICDEFLISDGYSSDETWEALQILERRYPARSDFSETNGEAIRRGAKSLRR